MDLGLHYWNFSNPDIAPQQLVLQPRCQSVHSAGPKTRRYQRTVLSDQRERRQVVNSQFATHAELFDLSGKRGLVTGGTRGIGMMIARGLLQAGARVVISSRSAEACAQAQEQLSEYGDVWAVPADLSRAR
jgi:FlaA1/EpsC-like NDP-sugar epimerase